MRCCRYFLVLLALTLSPARAETPGEIFDRVWELVEARHVGSSIDLDSLGRKGRELLSDDLSPRETASAVNSYLARLGTSHTELFHKSDPRYYQLLDVFAYGPKGEEIRSLFGGKLPHYPGILAEMEGDSVRSVITGGPDELHPGDKILKVEDESFRPVESFRGREGMPTELTVRRGESLMTFTVTPRDIQPRLMFLQAIEDSATVVDQPPYRTGYVRMWSYAGEPYQEKLKALLTGPLASINGLVLDLRGPWGGASPDFLELFSAQPNLSMTTEGETATLPAPGFDAPLVVLTDESVSSGKEIMAFALKKSRRGLLVGEKTRGAVLGGSLHLLPDGYALYLAEADVRVDGERLEGIGVFPDEWIPAEMHIVDGVDDLPRTGRSYLRVALLKDDLSRRRHLDQYVLTEISDEELKKRVLEDNTRWLEQVLANYGWPSRSLFGEDAAAAWLIAQHSSDLVFQKRALMVLRETVAKGEAPKKELAYLEDRVLINQGLPQIYGTQVERRDGQIVARPIHDAGNVDSRRKEVGLGPLREYLDSFKDEEPSSER